MKQRERTPARRPAAVFALAVALSLAAMGEDEVEARDQELLEFLGSFDATDQDWLTVSIEQMVAQDEDAPAGDDDRVEAAKDED